MSADECLLMEASVLEETEYTEELTGGDGPIFGDSSYATLKYRLLCLLNRADSRIIADKINQQYSTVTG
jgi:hypothetical protein